MNKQTKFKLWLATGLVIFSAVSRIVNTEIGFYNLAPVAAAGLFAGAVIRDRKLALLVTLASMFISDVYIGLFTDLKGFYGISQLFVYSAYILITFLGGAIKKMQPEKIVGFALLSSVLFFVISNFGVYVSGSYGYSVAGLITTFEMAIPFFKNSLLSDLLGAALLFGSYQLFGNIIPAKLKASEA